MENLNNITSAIFNSSLELKEDEYMKDGLPYCKNCNGARATVLEKNVVVRCVCKCQAEENLRLELEKKKEETLQVLQKRKSLSCIGKNYFNSSFEKAKITKFNQEAYKVAKNYVDNARAMYENGIGLYITGKNSTGKTYLTACISNALIEKNYSCLYTSMCKILTEIQGSFHENGETESEILMRIQNVNFLFLDDLGKEFIGITQNRFAEKILLNVLNVRYVNNLPTIFSSNYTIEELGKIFKLDIAILERINEMSTKVIHLNGDDFRLKKLEEKKEIAKKYGVL